MGRDCSNLSKILNTQKHLPVLIKSEAETISAFKEQFIKLKEQYSMCIAQETLTAIDMQGETHLKFFGRRQTN